MTDTNLQKFFVIKVNCTISDFAFYEWMDEWLLVEDGIPQTLEETLDFANPELYSGIYIAVKALLTYPVLTCVAERSFR